MSDYEPADSPARRRRIAELRPRPARPRDETHYFGDGHDHGEPTDA